MAILWTGVEIFQAGPKWWTDIAIPRAILLAWLKIEPGIGYTSVNYSSRKVLPLCWRENRLESEV